MEYIIFFRSALFSSYIAIPRYEGRYDVLDSNLKKKYGVGFLPQMPTITVSPQLSTSTSKLLSSVKDQKARIVQKVESAARKQKKRGDDDKNMEGKGHVCGLGKSVCLTVQCDEVIPIVCGRHTPSKDLKYYLIDCRPDSSQNEGKFPTSVSASSLMDPEKLEALESLFESLRGAVHICVMGGGYAALKMLYDHDLTRHEVALATEDDSVTSSCALFFIKRGYPFVSILDGGFAAAHAWLCRNNEALTPSTVLVNYDPKVSTLAQLERAYNASSTERTQMKLQHLLDNSSKEEKEDVLLIPVLTNVSCTLFSLKFLPYFFPSQNQFRYVPMCSYVPIYSYIHVHRSDCALKKRRGY